jgi:hypothetical protein
VTRSTAPVREHPLADALRAQSTRLDELLQVASLPPSHAHTEQLLDGARQLGLELLRIAHGRG